MRETINMLTFFTSAGIYWFCWVLCIKKMQTSWSVLSACAHDNVTKYGKRLKQTQAGFVKTWGLIKKPAILPHHIIWAVFVLFLMVLMLTIHLFMNCNFCLSENKTYLCWSLYNVYIYDPEGVQYSQQTVRFVRAACLLGQLDFTCAPSGINWIKPVCRCSKLIATAAFVLWRSAH